MTPQIWVNIGSGNGTLFTSWYLEHFLWKWLAQNSLDDVDIGPGNGLVLSGNKPITWTSVYPVLCCHMVSLGHNELKTEHIDMKKSLQVR